ncbi:MAG: translation elongation factor-like protein [Candidatus Aenigmarchaeota archaeon]|nr:translation elongation factor-like protein [Candidatus Aenigmarchaeota archaeon]
MAKRLVGIVRHFYPKIGVAVVDVESDFSVGDRVSFEGPNTDLVQTVESIQVDGKSADSAKKGIQVAIKTNGVVHLEDHLYLEPD